MPEREGLGRIRPCSTSCATRPIIDQVAIALHEYSLTNDYISAGYPSLVGRFRTCSMCVTNMVSAVHHPYH
ncbi:MAG: hypothetical protein R3C44_04955 [Chloroflexota bacterium]